MATPPGPNDPVLSQFFVDLGTAATSATSANAAATLVGNYFSPNAGAVLATVGLTDYAPNPLGPVFSGQAEIIALFARLFKAFSSPTTPTPFAFTEIQPSNKNRLYSLDASQIAVQATMTGTQLDRWFPFGTRHYSEPISGLAPNTATPKIFTLPVCAVFAFDGTSKILNLSLFFDRYRMLRQLNTP